MAIAADGELDETGQVTQPLRRGGGQFPGFALSIFAAALAIVAWGVAEVGLARVAQLPDILYWLGAVALVNLFPIRSSAGAHLTLDLPVLLACGFLMGPVAAGSVALLATLDREEMRAQGFLWVGLANRGQTALSVLVGAETFVLLDGHLQDWPATGVAAAAALAADMAVNYLLVSIGAGIRLGNKPGSVLRSLALGAPGTFALAYVCFGLLSVLTAELYAVIGSVAIAIVLAPLILAYQSFRLRSALLSTQRRLMSQSRALAETSRSIADERRDERLAVAGELHDELLPPLFKVHLMGQVVRHDLASGRLLALDDDVPELISATEAAHGAVRGLVRDLRYSSLGSGGLNGTLRVLASQLESAGGPRHQLSLVDHSWSRLTQLVIYQIAREAMRNATQHAAAKAVRVQSLEFGGKARIVIEDDGVGFDPKQVDHTTHFGLELVRERAEAVGGQAVVESEPGKGTRVVVAVPVDL